MKIEIKLKDPESCEGCPFVYGEYKPFGEWAYEYCSKGYRVDKETKIRPAQCKEENGL